MSNINIDINSTPQNVEVTVSEFRGRSAYQVWLDAGNTGSLEDFFLAIGTFNPETSASLIDTFETKGSGILSGSVLNYIPVIVSESSQIQINNVSGFSSFSSSVDYRLLNVEEFSSSLDATFATDVEISASQQSTLNYVNTFTQSYYVDSSSFDNRVNELEGFSSSLDTIFATDEQLQSGLDTKLNTSSFDDFTSLTYVPFSQSVDNRLDLLETESGSIRNEFNSYTSSNDIIISGLNSFTQSVIDNYSTKNELQQTSSFLQSEIDTKLDTGSFLITSQSIDFRLDNLEIQSGSSEFLFNEYTSSNDLKVQSLEIESASIRSTFNSFTQSIIGEQNDQNERLDSLEIESTSIRSTVNSYTSSTDNRLQYLETESGSIRIELNSYTQSTDIRLDSLETESVSVRVDFNEYTSSTDIRLDLLEIESSSVRLTLNSYTQSNDLRVQNLEVESGSIRSTLNSYTQSTDLRIQSLEIESGSVRTEFNTYTESTDNRLSSLELESGSIRSVFNTYTSSNDITNNTQTDRLNQLSTESGSIRSTVNSYTQSNDELNTTQNNRLTQLETESGSVNGRLVNIENFTSSQIDLNNTFATTGSNVFEGNQTINGDVFVSANIVEFTASLVVNGGITGSLKGTADTASYVNYFNIDNLPTLVSGSSQLTSSYDGRYELQGRGILSSSQQIQSDISGAFTSVSQSISADIISIDLRLDSLETESGSIRNEFNNYTQSADLRLESLELESGSIRSTFNSYTASNDLRLQSLEIESGSIRTELNQYTQSTDSRLDSIETESGSIRTEFNSYTQSTDDIIFSLQIESSSIRSDLNSYTASTDSRLGSLEIESGSIRTTFNYYTSSNDTLNIAQNDRLTSLEIESASARTVFNSYTQSNDTTNTTQNGRLDQLSIASASSANRLTNLELFSGSINTKFDTLGTYTSSIDTKFSTLAMYTESNDTLNTQQNSRLNSLESESGSIRSTFNSYTSSTDNLNIIQNNRLTQLETESGSVKGRLSTIESFTSSYATTGSNVFLGTQTINGNLIIDGDLTAKNFYIDSSSIIYTSGSTKFGDTIDDTHQFTGSVDITGSITLNGLPIGTGKLDETVFNSYTQSTDLRLESLELESGSIRSIFNSYTQSTDLRLGNIESVSGSWVTSDITASSVITASVNENVITFTKGDNTTFDITVQLSGSVIPGLVSGSDQLTSSYDNRYELQGRGILSGSVLNYIPVIVSQSSQIDITQTTNYTEFSSSITDTISSQSVRLNGIDTFTASIDNRVDNIEFTTASFDLRLDSLEIESGSIRSVFNQFTASYNTGSFLGDLIGTASYSVTSSHSLTTDETPVIISSTPPTGVDSGSLWWNTTDAKTYIYYSGSWIDIIITTPPFPYTGSAQISGSLIVNGFIVSTSNIVSPLFSGSLLGNADTSTTASYALTASYIDGGFY